MSETKFFKTIMKNDAFYTDKVKNWRKIKQKTKTKFKKKTI
jgi:hypothetical protein